MLIDQCKDRTWKQPNITTEWSERDQEWKGPIGFAAGHTFSETVSI